MSFTEDSAYSDYHPREGKAPEPEEKCLTTAADADALRVKALERFGRRRIQDCAALKRLPYLLFRWRAFAADDGAEVKTWTAAQMEHDAMIVTSPRPSHIVFVEPECWE